MDKKDLIYILIIGILGFLLVREFNDNVILPQRETQQDTFTEALPKMGK